MSKCAYRHGQTEGPHAEPMLLHQDTKDNFMTWLFVLYCPCRPLFPGSKSHFPKKSSAVKTADFLRPEVSKTNSMSESQGKCLAQLYKWLSNGCLEQTHAATL